MESSFETDAAVWEENLPSVSVNQEFYSTLLHKVKTQEETKSRKLRKRKKKGGGRKGGKRWKDGRKGKEEGKEGRKGLTHAHGPLLLLQNLLLSPVQTPY